MIGSGKEKSSQLNNNEELISIIQSCLAGNTESFSRIIAKFQRKIYYLCFNYIGNHQDAEDAAMEIFIKVYNSLGFFNMDYQFSTWIFKITSNHMKDILRKKKREKKYLISRFFQNKEPHEAKTPETVFLKKMRKDKFREAFRLIPFKYQTALILKYDNELSYQQISEILDIPTNTVGSLIYRGKVRLKEKLKELGV